MTASGVLDLARESFARRLWAGAYRDFAAADAATPLEPADLESLALAAYLSGHDEESTRVWTRAHHEALRRDEPMRAAEYAVHIGAGLLFRGEAAPAMGWFARGERALEGCGDCPERAWLRTWNAFVWMWAGEFEKAHPAFADSAAAGRRYGDLDLLTMARLGDGMTLVLQGDAKAGMPLLDEVMAGVTSGEVSPMYAGIVYCTVIAGCSGVFDLRRAREWTEALTRWCDAQPELVPFRGNCLVHRCELMQLDGSWREAVAAAQQACDHLSGSVKWDTLGSAYYQLGELQRLRGDYPEAEESFRKANEAGRSPEPGLALLRLAQGRADIAVGVLARAVSETLEPTARSRILPAYVETLLVSGDVESARGYADELKEIAELIDAPYLHAMADAALGAVLLAEGEAGSALRILRVAATTWRTLNAPYETARVRVLIGAACNDLGDPETATLEIEAARKVFDELGAKPDLDRLTGPGPGSLTAREAEVLSLLAAGKTNRMIARDLGLAEKTVARHVSNIFTKTGVPSRAAATAYAYEHHLIQVR
ncbi:LuxR C-terminal-related transcriptional regulator [Kribbella sp. NPDC050470]|uniref:helix-turn-helix transcriptional regulator n=1 Tax=unclassified Kribbella TaxID=2644121 RepID=UPI0037A46872